MFRALEPWYLPMRHTQAGKPPSTAFRSPFMWPMTRLKRCSYRKARMKFVSNFAPGGLPSALLCPSSRQHPRCSLSYRLFKRDSRSELCGWLDWRNGFCRATCEGLFSHPLDLRPEHHFFLGQSPKTVSSHRSPQELLRQTRLRSPHRELTVSLISGPLGIRGFRVAHT